MGWAIDPANTEDNHCQGAESRAGYERAYGSYGGNQDEDSHRSCLLGVFGDKDVFGVGQLRGSAC